jgi:hypothetical protein
MRRTHLYFGLFLLPWAMLYGVTGLLFNHPGLFADAPVLHYSRADLAGTPLADPVSPDDQARAVLDQLNANQKPASPYTLGTGNAWFSGRDTFIAMVHGEERSFSVTFDPRTGSGMIRETSAKPGSKPAPFAAGQAQSGGGRMGMGGRGGMGPMQRQSGGISIESGIPDRLKDAIPRLLEKKGLPGGKVMISQSPEIKFPVLVNGETWTASWNPLTTAVTGTPGADRTELSLRSFLLRMHLTRGYPGEFNLKWFWAVGVDAMALVLCFWAISGIFMWWQIKSTRKAGFAVVAISAVAAGVLGVGMWGLLAA